LTSREMPPYDLSQGRRFRRHRSPPMNSYFHERLMLSLLRRDSRSRSDFDGIQGGTFVELCRLHRVAGLVYQQAGREPAAWGSLLPGLREAARKTLVDNLVLLNALRDVASALGEEGIGFVLLKGASLLGLLYPEIQHRPMTDVDLLIREKDWSKVRDTLTSRGYRLPAEDSQRYYAENWYHQLVESPGNPPTNLEFHWNLESVERSRIDPEELIREAVPCEIEGERYLRLCDHHLMVHLAVHLAHHYQSPALIWAEDIRRLIERGGLDWERIGSTARAWGVENCLAYSLGYVERAFPGTLPAQGRGFRLSPARRLIMSAFRTEDPSLPHLPLEGRRLRHAVSMVLLDRWGDVARYIAIHSFRRATRVAALPSATGSENP
jgi:putative nucleotidyltransferase-like protein